MFLQRYDLIYLWPRLRKGGQMRKNQNLSFCHFQCCNISKQLMWKFYGNIYSTFRDMAILYIGLITNLAFVFHLIFQSFSWSQQYCILHSQIYNFLIVWLGPLIFGMYIHQLIRFNCVWQCCTCDLDLWPQGQITDCNMKILCLAHNFLSLGLDLKFLACG